MDLKVTKYFGGFIWKKRLFSSLNKPNVVLRFFFFFPPNKYLAVIFQLGAMFPCKGEMSLPLNMIILKVYLKLVMMLEGWRF